MAHIPKGRQMENSLFTCRQIEDGALWLIDFGERSSANQVEFEDYDNIFVLKSIAKGNRFCITGRNSVVAYFAVAYYLARWGADEVHIEMLNQQRYTLLDQTHNTPETKPWLTAKASLFSIVSNQEAFDGKWGEDILQHLKVPVLLPAIDESVNEVTITGKGSILMYAALGIAFGKYKQNITKKVQCPHQPYETCFYEDKMEIKPLHGNKNGIIIGILGDPNSGKSVFSHSFFYALKNSRKTDDDGIWIYDCDMAAPTPEWYLNRAEENSPESRARKKIKTGWSEELEQKVIKDLAVMRTRLDILIADMPGGLHPKEEDKSFLPQRIPGHSRGMMMSACDAYIVLCKGGDDRIFNAWKAALKEYELDGRILARFNTFLAKERPMQFSMTDVYFADSLYHAEIYNLERKINKQEIIQCMMKASKQLINHILNF